MFSHNRSNHRDTIGDYGALLLSYGVLCFLTIGLYHRDPIGTMVPYCYPMVDYVMSIGPPLEFHRGPIGHYGALSLSYGSLCSLSIVPQ